LADALDLTGVWNGLYSYPRAKEPVSFLATLAETDTWLSGVTEEIASAGTMRGQTITATLQGRRTAHAVTFLKTYDDLPHGYDTVHYTGDVNDDGSEIEGRWTIPGVWSGKFLLIRANRRAIALTRDVAEQV
jgi:hypothetical protein